MAGHGGYRYTALITAATLMVSSTRRGPFRPPSFASQPAHRYIINISWCKAISASCMVVRPLSDLCTWMRRLTFQDRCVVGRGSICTSPGQHIYTGLQADRLCMPARSIMPDICIAIRFKVNGRMLWLRKKERGPCAYLMVIYGGVHMAIVCGWLCWPAVFTCSSVREKSAVVRYPAIWGARTLTIWNLDNTR